MFVRHRVSSEVDELLLLGRLRKIPNSIVNTAKISTKGSDTKRIMNIVKFYSKNHSFKRLRAGANISNKSCWTFYGYLKIFDESRQVDFSPDQFKQWNEKKSNEHCKAQYELHLHPQNQYWTRKTVLFTHKIPGGEDWCTPFTVRIWILTKRTDFAAYIFAFVYSVLTTASDSDKNKRVFFCECINVERGSVFLTHHVMSKNNRLVWSALIEHKRWWWP